MALRVREGLGIAGLAAAAHATALAAGFTWLDHGDLERGYAIAPLAKIATLFAHGFARSGFYRPLTAITLSLDAAANLGPAMFHATNLLLHAAAAVMVAVAALELGLERRAALLAGALFGVHPVTTLVASQISYRAEALLTALLLGALVAHRRERPLLGALLLLLAGLTKETGLVLGPLLLLVDRPKPKLLAIESTGWLAALGLRLAFAPSWHASMPPLTIAEHVATRAGALATSFAALLGPASNRLCDDVPILSPTSALAWLGLALFAAMLALGWRNRLMRLFALAMLPSLALVPVPRFWSPHYLYVPLAFAAIALASVATRVRWLPEAALAGLALLSLHDARRYRDDTSLFAAELAERPMCREGWLYVGDARRESGALDGAVEAYQRALAPTPGALAYVDSGAALQNLGITELARGQPVDAEHALRAALAEARTDVARRALVHDLAAARLAEGHPEDAASMLEPETQRPDAQPASLLLRAKALIALGRAREANELLARVPR